MPSPILTIIVFPTRPEAGCQPLSYGGPTYVSSVLPGNLPSPIVPQSNWRPLSLWICNAIFTLSEDCTSLGTNHEALRARAGATPGAGALPIVGGALRRRRGSSGREPHAGPPAVPWAD